MYGNKTAISFVGFTIPRTNLHCEVRERCKQTSFIIHHIKNPEKEYMLFDTLCTKFCAVLTQQRTFQFWLLINNICRLLKENSEFSTEHAQTISVHKHVCKPGVYARSQTFLDQSDYTISVHKHLLIFRVIEYKIIHTFSMHISAHS